MIDNIYHQGHFKDMASFDLGDLMTLKHNMFLLAIQGLACIPIWDLLITLQLAIFEEKLFVTLTLMTSVFIKFDISINFGLYISTICWHTVIIVWK